MSLVPPGLGHAQLGPYYHSLTRYTKTAKLELLGRRAPTVGKCGKAQHFIAKAGIQV